MYRLRLRNRQRIAARVSADAHVERLDQLLELRIIAVSLPVGQIRRLDAPEFQRDGGGLDQLWKQAIAAGAVMAYSFVVAYLIAFVIKKTMGIRISTDEEEKGIDAKFHRDAAYELQPA